MGVRYNPNDLCAAGSVKPALPKWIIRGTALSHCAVPPSYSSGGESSKHGTQAPAESGSVVGLGLTLPAQRPLTACVTYR